MKKKYCLINGIVLLLLLFINMGCQKQTKNEKLIITIGAALPLTGPIASYGKNSKSGVDLALEEINTIGNFVIRVIYEDDGGEAKNAVSAVQKLISTNRVPLIVGEASSGFSLAVAPICNKNKVVLFSPVSSAAELTERGGDYFFRVCPSDAFQASILSRWILEKNIKNISLLYVNSNWGISLKDEFLKNYLKGGGNVITIETCKEGDRDFKSHLGKLFKPQAQAIVAFTPPKEGGPLVRQARELGVRIPLYGGDFWGTPEFLESAGDAAEGVFFTFPASPSGVKYDEFVEKYHNKFNKNPDIYAAYSYDLMNIVANALKSGATSGKKIREYLLNMPTYEGITGPTKFDENGDVITKTFDRKTIKNGHYILVN